MKLKLLFFCTLFIASIQAFAFKCTIQGVVINSTYKTLLLKKATDDTRVIVTKIPVINNRFQYSFTVNETAAYHLIFEEEVEAGSWYSVVFFPVGGNIRFELTPSNESEPFKVDGGKLNAQYVAYVKNMSARFDLQQENLNKQQQLLHDSNQLYTAEWNNIIKMDSKPHEDIDRAITLRREELRKTGDRFTPEGKALKRQQDSLNRKIVEWRYAYIKQNHDLLSYYLVMEDSNQIRDNTFLADNIKEAYPTLAEKYPDHSYTSIVHDNLNALYKIKVGRPLIPFSAPAINGTVYDITKLTQGKITLLDLWGSWCGPCIAATRTMLPVYNEFKDKGFNIIGLAREYHDTRALVIALKRERYPWLNLVELNDKNQIWSKYGISNSAGLMLLIGKDGKILAIDPTAQQVRKILLQRL